MQRGNLCLMLLSASCLEMQLYENVMHGSNQLVTKRGRSEELEKLTQRLVFFFLCVKYETPLCHIGCYWDYLLLQLKSFITATENTEEYKFLVAFQFCRSVTLNMRATVQVIKD